MILYFTLHLPMNLQLDQVLLKPSKFPFLNSELKIWLFSHSNIIIRKASLLTEAPAFDEHAINAEFQEEYNRLEQESQTLDLEFQALVKELRLWIASSISPLNDAAKAK